MADVVLFKIAGGIIGQVGNPALQEIGLLWGVKDELAYFSKCGLHSQVFLSFKLSHVSVGFVFLSP